MEPTKPSKKRKLYKNVGSSVVGSASNPTAKGPSATPLASGRGDKRQQLPVRRLAAALLEADQAHQTVVLVAETGSGKSTQVPQLLLEAGLVGPATVGGGVARAPVPLGRKLVCTQPRRMAAITLAERVRSEMSAAATTALSGSRAAVGSTAAAAAAAASVVGHAVRFEDTCGPGTAVRYATDGVLLREAMSDPNLRAYGTIILDEAHER